MSLFAARIAPTTPPVRSQQSTADKIVAFLSSSMTACASPSSNERNVYQSRSCSVFNENPKRAGARSSRQSWSFEDAFVASLVTAGSCSRHPISSTLLGSIKTWKTITPTLKVQAQCLRQERCFSSRSRDPQEALARTTKPNISREQYVRLVNTYPSFDFRQLESELGVDLEVEYQQNKHFPLAPRLVLSPEQEIDIRRQGWQPSPPQDEDHAQQLQHFERRLKKRLGRISLDTLWKAYQSLPSPRPRYFSLRTVQRLFRHIAWVQFRTVDSMEMYFGLLDECLEERVPLTESIWNTAIVYAGRWLRNATSEEVKGAIETWTRMEQSGHQADNITFNILFQVAVRAGRFALADTIFNELKARGMPLDRYFRANLIYYAGARRDGEGVRQAFRELVNAGDIVDTGVMNAVILSFFRAGEAPAAEHTFYRMKELHELKFGTLAPKEWQSKKELSALLNTTGQLLRDEKQQHEASFFGAQFSTDSKREEIQRASPIAPDEFTYRILIKHHAYTSGDIDRIRELLGEMKERELHVHGSVYVHLLRGFQTHGGYALSKWNRGSLEELWGEILAAAAQIAPNEAIDSDGSFQKSLVISSETDNASYSNADADAADLFAEDDDLIVSELHRPAYFTKSLALAAVHAFYKCTGKSRMLEVWYEILVRWKDISTEDKTSVQEVVKLLASTDSMYID